MNRQAQKGFTLTELMIALLVFSFVATTGVYTLRIGAEAREQLETAEAQIRDVEIMRALIKNDLLQIKPRSVRDEFGDAPPQWFYGGDAHPRSAVTSGERLLVSFVRDGWANPEAAEPRSSLQHVMYLEREGQLIRRVRPYLDGARGQPMAERVILSDLTDLNVEFLRGEVSGRFDWADEWPTGGGVDGANPRAVALTVTNQRYGEMRLLFLDRSRRIMSLQVKHCDPQRGGALITVLFLVVILSFLVLSISQTATLASQRAFASRAHSEMYWRAVGLEELARSAVKTAIEQSEEALTAESPLFATVYDLPMEGATAQLAFTDNTRCLNLNSFSESAGRNRRGTVNKVAQEELVALAENLSISNADVAGLAAVAADWIDADDFQEARGAEDNFYTALPTPYRTGGTMLADVTELRAMANVDAELYRQLAPFLCAHPASEPTPVNVNLLTPSDAPILAAVLGGKSLAEAQNIIASRPPGGYQKISDFESSAGVKVGQGNLNQKIDNQAEGLGNRGGTAGTAGGGGNNAKPPRLDVKSRYLAARGVIEQGGMSLELNIIFKVEGTEASVISRRIGRRV